jgi:acetyl esterase/lipase
MSSILEEAYAEGAVEPSPVAAKSPVPVADFEGVIFEKDIVYLAAERTEKADLYLPANRAAGTRSPGIVIIHGGGWRGGEKAASREINIGTNLARAGYVCLSIDYRLNGENIWPTNLQDCKNAVRFLRKNAEKYGIDTAHIGVIGGSAGGHLALMVGYTDNVNELAPKGPYPGISDSVQAVVNLYGIADVRTCRETEADGTPTEKLKDSAAYMLGPRAENADKWALASPVTHLRKDGPPVLILHGTADTTVDRDQSTMLAARLKEIGIPHELHLIEGIGHTFDLQTWNRKPLPNDLRPLVIGFFDRYLKRVSQSKPSAQQP